MAKNPDEECSRLAADRRDVLKGLAATGAAGALGLAGSQAVAGDHRDLLTPEKIQEHIDLRQDIHGDVEGTLVEGVRKSKTGGGPTGQFRILGDRNDDETVTTSVADEQGNEQPARPWVYVKGFDPVAEKYMQQHVHDGVDESLDAMLAGENFADTDFPDTSRPLISPASAVSTTTEGTDAWLPQIPPAPNHDSGKAYLEMVECYMMALLRDVPFSAYPSIDPNGDRSDPNNALAAAVQADYDYLASEYDAPGEPWFEGFGDYLLRDPVPGCDVGPYVSQFWYHDVPIGGMVATPKIKPIVGTPETGLDGPPFGTTQAEWREMVFERDGAEPGHDATPDVRRGAAKWPSTGRDLASQVRDDPAYQPYLLTGLQLLSWGVPFTEGMSYHDEERVNPYIDFGAVALLDVLARVCRNALIAAWNQKWYVHRRLRPETYACRVEDIRAGNVDLELDEQFVRGHTVEATVDQHGTAFLPQVYPEGGPAHPAYPSGHSVIAGACATVLKSFFRDVDITQYLPEQDGVAAGTAKHAPSADGKRLEADDGGESLSVHGEINKLASNIGMARLFAGVHYRSDHLYGMVLGQQVAVATMWSHFTRNSQAPGYVASSTDNRIEYVNAGYSGLIGRNGHPYDGSSPRLTENSFEQHRRTAMRQPF